MKRKLLGALAALALSGCAKEAKPPALQVELKRVTDDSFEVIPSTGQMPYCLLFTTTGKGVVRQLTMTHENRSLPCPAGKAVGNVRFRVPVDEGPVTVLAFFSSEKLNAGSVAQQVYDLSQSHRDIDPMNLRAPGRVSLVEMQFRPEAAGNTTVGGRISAGGVLDAGMETDAGAPGDAGG